jgi:hypothetical protein
MFVQSGDWYRLAIDEKDPGLGDQVSHTMFLLLACFITTSISYDQDRRRGMNLDVYVRVFAVTIVLRDQDGRRVQLLCGEGAAWHGCDKSNGW